MKNLFLITLAILFSFQTTFAQSGRTAGGVVWDLLPGGGYAKQITSEANGNLWVIPKVRYLFFSKLPLYKRCNAVGSATLKSVACRETFGFP